MVTLHEPYFSNMSFHRIIREIMFYFWNIRSFLYRTALTMKMFFENVQKSPLSNFSKPTYFAELTRMCYLFVHMDHWRHLLNSKELISVANPLMFVIICHIYLAKKSYAVSMATGMHTTAKSVGCLVLCPLDQDRNVSAKLTIMRGRTFKRL